MRVVIDRFEGKYAVCEKEDRELINIERNKLPATAKEGDVLIIDGEEVKLDKTETEARQRKVEKLAGDLWE
ncbi:MAG: DUF3006 domain-containing protein [Zhaonellaceae bacterium]|jgi:hypothetical protein|nr:DUF3006 domain-containing protein [Clostridia bacterium]